MSVAGAAMSLELEMMMFDVLQAMAHFRLTTPECLAPPRLTVTRDAGSHSNGVELRVNHHLRPKGTTAKLGAGQVEIIFLFEFVIGKLVSSRHPDSIRLSVGGNQIQTRNLGLLAAVFRVPGNVEGFSMRSQREACAFVKP